MYTIHTAYKDSTGFFVKVEHADSISSALSAAAIYLEDPSCFMVKIWKANGDNDGEFILNYWRE